MADPTRISCPDLYVDFSHFPTQFRNEDEALNTYNALGVELKIQFKKQHRQRNAKG